MAPHGQEALRKAQTMKIVTVISVWSQQGRAAAPVHYDVLATDGYPSVTLEDAFAITNIDGRPMGRQACAITTGDVVILDGQHYLVEDRGFHPLTDAEAKTIIQLSALQTCRGYAWLVQNHVILSPPFSLSQAHEF